MPLINRIVIADPRNQWTDLFFMFVLNLGPAKSWTRYAHGQSNDNQWVSHWKSWWSMDCSWMILPWVMIRLEFVRAQVMFNEIVMFVAHTWSDRSWVLLISVRFQKRQICVFVFMFGTESYWIIRGLSEVYPVRPYSGNIGSTQWRVWVTLVLQCFIILLVGTDWFR